MARGRTPSDRTSRSRLPSFPALVEFLRSRPESAGVREIARAFGLGPGDSAALRGMLRAIETGYVQREIQDAAYRYQRAIESREEIVVGVNRFQIDAEPQVPLLRIDPSLEQAQVERVRALRARRDAHATEAALNKLEQAATTSENLLPRILECVESLATVGEISNCLRSVWGEYREAVTL